MRQHPSQALALTHTHRPCRGARGGGAEVSVCLFAGAPGLMSASPYAGAGFPPTFAIPQAAGRGPPCPPTPSRSSASGQLGGLGRAPPHAC